MVSAKKFVDCQTLLDSIARYELWTPEGFDLLTFDDFERLYNGCGPEWMPCWTRRLLTMALILFALAFLIHDCDFALADGSKERFHAANLRLLRNCRRIVAANYSWWRHPLRWFRWRRRAMWIYLSCDTLGFSAYEKASRAETP